MPNDAPSTAWNHRSFVDMIQSSHESLRGAVARDTIAPATMAERRIKPLASYAREPWRPGPPFWGPTKTPVDTDAPEPEELLIPLVLPIFITASVFLSMLLILA